MSEATWGTRGLSYGYKMEPVHVECYSGFTYAQEPRAIIWHGFRVPVVQVLGTWRTPHGPAFRVRLGDGALVELHFDEHHDHWLLGHTSPSSPKD